MHPLLTSVLFVTILASPLLAVPVHERPRQIEAESYRNGRERRLLGSSFNPPGPATYDYVVVGGGTAGLTIATRLAEDSSKSVAVIEAGTFYEISNGNLSQIPLFGPGGAGKSPLDTYPTIDWQFQTTPQAGMLNVSVHYARGKCLGGSSARHFLTYQIGPKDSYERWASQVGDDAYSWDKFLPFFQKSQDFIPPHDRPRNATPEWDQRSLRSGGPLSITFPPYAMAFASWAQKALTSMGIKKINGFTSGNILGSSYQLLTMSKDFIRESSETSFLQKKGLKSTNLIVYQSIMAQKIVFDGTKATGVEITMGGIPFTISARKEVILSAGAFQSPQLLMVSGVGPKETLEKNGIKVVKDLPGVGQNMEDHILGGPSYRVTVSTSSAMGNPAFAANAVKQYLNSKSGMLTGVGADFLAWEKLPKNFTSSMSKSAQEDLAKLPAGWPDIEFFPTSAFYGNQTNFLTDGPADGGQYATVAIALGAPLSKGTVSISSADINTPPVINPNWLTHPTDMAVAIAGYKRARQVFSNMKEILIGPEYFPGAEWASDQQIEQQVRQSFGTVFHASCTCKMGKADDPMAVVDSKARVFGVTGLRVADASAFALLPPGHPQATVYALAEKIADDIKRGS
ncbi:oxidoreductase [Delitschia confertaspora ATCC 74209]|uniref:Oxidoreductase n=1 Tax=Delitschia confertaspora ATCC 74209 TaxID=1513339 RepID=A0A9P4MZM8_9PLEO|nr:oxidoreductase [Delitschia confertaspora ATCC 74209]